MALDMYGQELPGPPSGATGAEAAGEWEQYQQGDKRGINSFGAREALEQQPVYNTAPRASAPVGISRTVPPKLAGLANLGVGTAGGAPQELSDLAGMNVGVSPTGPMGPSGGMLPSERIDANRANRGMQVLDRDQYALYADQDRAQQAQQVRGLSRTYDQGISAFRQRNALRQKAKQIALSNYAVTEAPLEREY